MLDGLRISTLLLVAFAAGFLTRSALEENVAQSAIPRTDIVWHHRCGDVDGVKYLFEDVSERLASSAATSTASKRLQNAK